MNKLKLVFFILLLGCSSKKVTTPIVYAHAHNDYEHKLPLFEALDNYFISVEVDVHLIHNELYVSHDTPIAIDSSASLESLYLKPLFNRIKENNGKVYPGYDEFFYLMIDIKTDATDSYKKLKEILLRYESIISKVQNGIEELDKPVKIVVTGMKGRPFHQILADEPRYVSIDGRLNELDLNIPLTVMPYISENYNHYFQYSGDGLPSEEEVQLLAKLVEKTHKQRKKLRFWASPDTKEVWDFLLEGGVDLVNTDSLKGFRTYYLKRL